MTTTNARNMFAVTTWELFRTGLKRVPSLFLPFFRLELVSCFVIVILALDVGSAECINNTARDSIWSLKIVDQASSIARSDVHPLHKLACAWSIPFFASQSQWTLFHWIQCWEFAFSIRKHKNVGGLLFSRTINCLWHILVRFSPMHEAFGLLTKTMKNVRK